MRLFQMCEAMKWCHLPVDGGLYAQHPKLLEDWFVIFAERAEHQKREDDKRKRKNPK